MSDFDWDAQEDAEGFDWDAQEDIEKYNPVDTALMKTAAGAAGGLLDEASGVGEAVGRAVGVKGVGGSFSDLERQRPQILDWIAEGKTKAIQDFRKAYAEGRDKKRAMLAKHSRDNPTTSTVSEFAGMVASPLNKVVKPLSLAKGLAVIGGINAFGNSEKQGAELLGDTAIGTGLGLALGYGADKASPYIQKGVDKMGRGLRSGAERLMARTLGAEHGTIKKIGMEKVKGAAGQMLDDGNVGAFSNTDDLISKNAALKDQGGKLMGKAYDAIDDAGASTFNPREVAGVVDDKIGDVWRSPLNKGEVSQFDNTIESILARGPGDIPLSEAQILKQELGAAANWTNKLSPTAKEKMARDAYHIVSEQIDDAVRIGEKAVNQAGLGETLKRGKDLYSKSKTAESLLQNKQAREQGNKLFGLTDGLAGVGAVGYGTGTGDWEGAGAIMLGKKYLQKYGTQQGALLLNKVSKALLQSPKFAELAAKNPQAFNALATSVVKRVGGGAMKAAGFNPTEPGDDKQAREAFLDQ